MRFVISAVILVVLDQISKLWIINNMTVGQSIIVIKGIFSISYVQNKGAAFGIMQDKYWFFILAAIVVVSLITYYNIKFSPSLLMQYLSGLIAGGAIGNLIDRLIYNSVVDFLSIGWWPVFNLADMGIVCGCIGLLVVLLFFDGGNFINAD